MAHSTAFTIITRASALDYTCVAISFISDIFLRHWLIGLMSEDLSLLYISEEVRRCIVSHRSVAMGGMASIDDLQNSFY